MRKGSWWRAGALTTPPPPRSDWFAALTIEVTERVVIDVRTREIFAFKIEDGGGVGASGEMGWSREAL